ncbi:MAG: NADH-quinone oxidoreductase subunit J [Candidatus Eremiobacterota bacterium]
MDGGNPAAFYLLAGMVLAAALGVVHARNLFHSGISLITCFLGVAGLYVLLQAHFVAGLQVLIYAGAVAVILLFAFMLTHHIMSPEAGTLFTQPLTGPMAAAATGILLTAVAVVSPWYRGGGSSGGGIGRLGQELLTSYLLPFELVSVFLLAALVGAVVIARKEEGPRS